MNIGFDASRAFINNRTGTENYSYQLLKHLIQLDQNHNYHIYIRPNSSNPSNLPYPSGSSISFHTIPFPYLWTQAGLALQTFKDPLDVLFVPSHTLPLIRKPKLKTVVTVHDLGAEYLPQTHQLKQRLYLNLMTHYQLKSATHLIAVSEATKKDLVNKVGVPEEKITVIYEGYNETLFHPCHSGVLNEVQHDRISLQDDILRDTLKHYELSTMNYLLFVGTIQPRKNLERLIKAYALFLKKDTQGVARDGVPHRAPAALARTSDGAGERQDPKQLKLILAGSKGWLSDEIYTLPGQLGIKDHVKFLGFVPDNHLPALYSGAKAFLFPSLFEGFGLPILEAMACGCPVLTSNFGSMKEIVTISEGLNSEELRKTQNTRVSDNQNSGTPDFRSSDLSGSLREASSPSHSESFRSSALLVDPYSVEDIAKGIYELTTNHKLRTTLTQKGFEQVKKFSWQKAAKETLAVLQKVARQ